MATAQRMIENFGPQTTFFDDEARHPHPEVARDEKLVPDRRSSLGQFLTPRSIAEYMASLFSELPASVRIIDSGAGAGALTSAFIKRWVQNPSSGDLLAHCYETDPCIIPKLRQEISRWPNQHISMEVIEGDFVALATSMIVSSKGPRYTHAILNPPYKKISSDSAHRGQLRAAGIETVNLYSGFVGLTLSLLEEGGELVAIIPRSFCNGPYYQPFRQYILKHASIDHIHLFASRNKAFKADGILQENVIIKMTRGKRQGKVRVSSSSDATFSDYSEYDHNFDQIVYPQDQNQFIHIPTDASSDELLRSQSFSFTLADLGLTVSTGPVVDFRLRDDLVANSEKGTVPLLYPGHFTARGLEWPKPQFKKPNAIRDRLETRKWLYPNGFYTVVRRFSSKEERRRVVASVIDPTKLHGDWIGIENHLNVFHEKKRPISEDMARGLSTYLNSTLVDQYFRRFNGHTQVNATDLRTLPYPARNVLLALGVWAKTNNNVDQTKIDSKMKTYI